MITYYQPLTPLKFPWRTPLVAVDKRDACIVPSYRPRIEVEPEDLSVIERRLFEANARDFKWVSEKVKDLPSYLTKYFITRYIAIFEKEGYQQANSFLRTKVAPATDRALMVLEKYKKLPTTQKVALLSKEFEDGEDPFHPVFFTEYRNPEDEQREQLSFDFDQAEKNRKPVKSRLLAELERDELKEMAFKLSQIIKSYTAKNAQQISQQFEPEEEHEIDECVVRAYELTAAFVRDTFGMKPPRKYTKQTGLSAAQDLLRLEDDNWWLGRLVRSRKIMREHLAIAMGQVSSKASPYASWDCVREHKAQQKKNWEAIQNMLLRDEDTEEEFELKDMVLKSVSNPAIRRHELMTRCRGCEDIGNELGLQGLFLTLTTPSKFHNTYKKGGFIEHWNGASPREAQDYLNHTWGLIRTKMSNEGLRWFGVRVAEPHHDGTPHWHLLLWVKPEDVNAIRDIFISYATQQDRGELHPQFEKEKKKPFRKGVYVGPLDYRPRCDFGFIDPELGTATGYIAKYISKNIDGFAMDDEISDETGKPVKEMAKNVSAWKSRWNIRQFQFFGGAPVTTYRELRRFANNDKASFMDYLTQLNYQELFNIYEELEVKAGRKLVGPPVPVELIKRNRKFDSKYLFNLLGELYQPSMENENNTVVDVMKAADHGNWHGYIMGQGGPFVKRKDLLITNVYEKLEYASPHGDTVRKLKGFDASGVNVTTRLKTFTITTKAKPTIKKEVEYEFDKPNANPSSWKFKKRTVSFVEVTPSKACALGSEATAFGASGSSRSSVNNCTEPEKVQVCDQLTRLLDPVNKRANKSPNIDEAALAALLKGSSIRIDDATSIQIRPAEVDEHGKKRPAQLVEVSRKRSDDTNWMDFEGWDNLFAQPEKQEYQQPDLSIFPDGDDWPLM